MIMTPRREGYRTLRGNITTRSHPALSENVPTVIVYCISVNQDSGLEGQELYLTRDGKPLASLNSVSKGDMVKLIGAVYSRESYDGSETYLMIEVFEIEKMNVIS